MYQLRHKQGEDKRQRNENKYPDESVLGNGEIRYKFTINYTVAYPGEKVGGKRELGDFVNQFGAPGGHALQIKGGQKG